MNPATAIDIQALPTQLVGKALGLSRKIKQLSRQKKSTSELEEKLAQLTQRAQQQLAQRTQKRPQFEYPENLPVSQQAEVIKQAILKHQVVVVAGETGSGKTTQLPKICLAAGLGVRGLIGHTQPRRVAATSVANRIAEEMNCALGTSVGAAVRFFDKTSKEGYIKVMTDGILLAEIQSDPLLTQYEAIIIDEAHERSINIDFLLGLLKPLLKKRKDLKLIITSATIDVDRFAEFFEGAPVITVEGRTYPVTIEYLPPDPSDVPHGEDPELWQINTAVREAIAKGPGDILIFLPGEGEIRQTAKRLRQLNLQQTTILPLYARLSIGEQQRVFRSIAGRKIVLATNVAETSLTVPGIRFVIDPGTARISRFSMRSKIQRLQVEKISMASANQRAGRCGRVAAGICYRLYSEEDFHNRTEFTVPEIKRTNLASVILQMKSMGIAEPEKFPFIENADERHWRDGQTLLFELGAVDQDYRLTDLGKAIAKLPVDPKLAVMLVSGANTALNEMLVIASLYSVRDPRERPHDKAQKADQLHAKWNDKRSDFATFINLWRDLHEQQEIMSNREFKEYCFANFINFVAWLDWRNTYRQLKQLMQQQGFKVQPIGADYEAIHCALMPALLTNILTKTNEAHYQGPRNSKVYVHPSSVNFKVKSAWLMAAELMETGRLYARATAPIEPEWIEPRAEHLAKVTYLDVHWRKTKGEACAYLQKSLFGLVYVNARLVGYSQVEPQLSRQWLIEKGLIDGDMQSKLPFHLANQKQLAKFREEETRQRRVDIIRSDEELVEFFESRIPPNIASVKQLERWVKKDWKGRNNLLTLAEEDLLNPEAELDATAFPKTLIVRGSELQLEYRFEPGHRDDGVSICIPVAMLKQFTVDDFEWLVPGLLQEKILAAIRALPKALRKNFIPAPDYASAVYQELATDFGRGGFFERMAAKLKQMSGVEVPLDAWQDIELADHLVPNFKIFDGDKKPIARGRDLAEMQQQLAQSIKKALATAPSKIEKVNASTEQAQGPAEQSLPQVITQWPQTDSFTLVTKQQNGGQSLTLLQAFEDLGDAVKVIGCESLYRAQLTHRRGVARLLLISLDSKKKYFVRSWQKRQELTRLATIMAPFPELIDDLGLALCANYLPPEPIESRAQFEAVQHKVAGEFNQQMNDHLSLLLSLLKKNQVISKQVYESVEPKFLQSYMDIRQQLDALWYAGCLYRHGLAKLHDYGRYLNGLSKRLERMSVNFPKEAENLRAFQAIERRVKGLAPSEHDKAYTEGLEQLRWMLEELRISLFAQEVKTAFPISIKRIEKQMDSLKKL